VDIGPHTEIRFS